MQANLRVFEQASDGEHRTDRNQRVADDLGDVDRDYGKQRRQQADRIAEQAGAPQAQCARALTATRNHEAKGAEQYVQREQGENHQRRASWHEFPARDRRAFDARAAATPKQRQPLDARC